jgi:hypothetical protein
VQILTPEALKYLHDQEHEVIIAATGAFILAGMVAMLKGLHSVWKVLKSVNSLVSDVKPSFEAHTKEDKTNFGEVHDSLTRVNVRQDLQEVTTDRLGNKIDGLSNRVDLMSQKMDARDPLFLTMAAQLKSIQANLAPSDASGD